MNKNTNKKIWLSIIITCFNEMDTIVQTIQMILNQLKKEKKNIELLVIDDASTDKSVLKIKKFIKKSSKNISIKLIENKINRGFIKSIKDGSLKVKGQFFWIVGGDATITETSIKNLLSKIGFKDIIIPNVKYLKRNMLRNLLSFTYTKIVNILSNTSIKYYNGSSIYITKDFLSNIRMVERFSYSAEMLIELLNSGKTYYEVDVEYQDIKKKSSALNFKNFFEVFIFFSKLIMKNFNFRIKYYLLKLLNK